MEPREQRVFPARLAMLAETATFVEGFCRRAGIGREDRLRLTLIVEELFTNTIAHGLGCEGDAPIRVELAREGVDVTLIYEDTAPAYNPLAEAPASAPRLAHPVESRPIGGLGVLLVGELARDARYAYEDGRNRLWLRIACAGRAATR